MQKPHKTAWKAAPRKGAKSTSTSKSKKAAHSTEKANQVTKSGQIWAWDLEELFSSPRKRKN